MIVEASVVHEPGLELTHCLAQSTLVGLRDHVHTLVVVGNPEAGPDQTRLLREVVELRQSARRCFNQQCRAEKGSCRSACCSVESPHDRQRAIAVVARRCAEYELPGHDARGPPPFLPLAVGPGDRHFDNALFADGSELLLGEDVGERGILTVIGVALGGPTLSIANLVALDHRVARDRGPVHRYGPPAGEDQ